MDSRTVRPSWPADRQDEALQDINRLWTIARVLSNTAHDVNNALHVIAGSAELLEARDLDPAVGRRVGIIRAEAAKAAAIIDHLLTYVRGAAQPARALDVWPLVERAVEMRTASLARSRIALSMDRAGARPHRAWIDEARTEQALLDLLLEAEENVKGTEHARIAVAVRDAGDFVEVTVAASSDGRPLGAADAGRPLSAASEVTRDAQLWTAARIAEDQRGSLAVVESDTGGTFTLRLPAHPD